jgi:hypothetical protein
MFNSTGYLPIASDNTLYPSPSLDQNEISKEECNPNPSFTLPSKIASEASAKLKTSRLPGQPGGTSPEHKQKGTKV